MESKINDKPSKHFSDKKFSPAPKKLLDPKAGQIIGITGGIATGKTFVLECMKKSGFEVFNADEVVHQLLLKDGRAFAQVSSLCPEAVTETGIDRKILGENIFSNPEKLKQLEAILHPLVRDEQVKFRIHVKQTTGRSIVFEVPLLFETKREQYYDQIIVTLCPEGVQKIRALARRNMTKEKFDSIIKLQMANTLKAKKADFVINTGRTPEDTINQVKRIIYNDQQSHNSTRYRDNRANKGRPTDRNSLRRTEK